MMDIMDTYNSDPMVNSYRKTASFHPNSVFLGRISKKMPTHYSHRVIIGDPCRVCGFDKNTGRNFGVITCSTCKAFFRRNGRTASALPPCRFGGQCPVNERTRRQCPTCRLAKCFAVGMQKDLIRTDEERAARLQLVKANRLQRQEKMLANVGSSSLNNKYQQRGSISHEVNAGQHFSMENNVSPFSSNDWIKLTNIRSAYEHFCLNPILQAEEQREEFLSSQPMKCRLKEHSFLNVLSVRLGSLVSFFRTTIPAFSTDLNCNDRAWLVRSNLRYLLLFSSMDLMHINGSQVHFDAKRACYPAYVYVYGQDLLKRGEQLIMRLNRLIGQDPAISKLFQIILFLSPSLNTNYNSKESYQPSAKTMFIINQAHETFVQILWSYLVYRYGEIEGQRLLMSIIAQVFHHQKLGLDMDRSLLERQPFSNLVYSMLTNYSVN